jgi:prevent-host-death family protein
MIVQTLKSDEARNRWRDMLDIVDAGGEVVIQRYNKPVAVLISYELFEELQEEIDERKAAKRVQAAVDEWRANPDTARPWPEVRAELAAEGLLDANG